MSEPQFTKGPWKWAERDFGEARIIACGDAIATVQTAGVEGFANLNLIAATPDLYEAAQAAKELLKPVLDEPGRSVFWKLADALAAARGERP